MKTDATDVLWQFSNGRYGPARDRFAARRKVGLCASMDDETKPTDDEAVPRMDGAGIGARPAESRDRKGAVRLVSTCRKTASLRSRLDGESRMACEMNLSESSLPSSPVFEQAG